ncbi:hypothetical protein QWY99_12890 [Flavobacterium branchiarum]|uniref:Carboxypeptidase-like regulatory domain-containing protein n=1 Tax=Flavobacterium branchiarum TaxID=1114870 RepID=A0ABV5FHN2_9FLAO|nr:hypothetical protein [Flavobacterium branchiarum]MDN3673949.1 hypothetical protein [Flavobacterium branchiarum]
MNRLFFLLFMLFSMSVLAQSKEYSIVVKDAYTQLPIDDATVVVLKTKQILLSNQDGKVTFMLTGSSSFQVLEANYEPLIVRWASLKDDEFVIYLKNKKNKLDEVVVSKDSPDKILHKIVSNSLKKLAVSCRLKVYVREFFILDNKYSYYNDGLVNFQFEINQKEPTTTLLVEQNRSYGLIDSDVSKDLKGYNLNNIMENYYSLNYLDPILDSKSKKVYDFIIKGHPTNKDYYVMFIKPIKLSDKVMDSFEIVYDPEKKLIIEFMIVTTPETAIKIEDKTSVGAKNVTRSLVKVNYRVDGSDYYLLSSNEEIAYDLVLKDKIKNIQVRNSFITTNFNKQKFTHRESDVFKEKTLFNKKNKILTNYWDTSGFRATDQEKILIATLDYKM